MPDPLLFVLGVLVTAVVGLAVWSIGLVGNDEGGAGGGSRPPAGADRP